MICIYFLVILYFKCKRHPFHVGRPSYLGLPGGGGGKWGNLKGPPKFTKGGPQKVELKKKYLEGFLYRQWYENFLDLNFTGICPKKCVLHVIL